MGDMLKADLDEIRSLGTQLGVKASAITQIAAPAKTSIEAVVMPDAGIEDLLGRITAKLETTLSKHSTAVQAMADGAATAAATYEDVEDVFRAQLTSLTEGLSQ